ncbi:hypothetical protein K435DRAFT_804897 [Dendrothele bispora CBS 962.96]|uniref:Uncharacterized protein n=1 Tax=Dendrothele bispora (strain CBS 962.96) TaxID=1314807 RepID=A0A4S8LCW0_DENBC|nr:hypothetical protein K435DRAFT_804897 [Dendrothele bispora CBS 962.96]
MAVPPPFMSWSLRSNNGQRHNTPALAQSTPSSSRLPTKKTPLLALNALMFVVMTNESDRLYPLQRMHICVRYTVRICIYSSMSQQLPALIEALLRIPYATAVAILFPYLPVPSGMPDLGYEAVVLRVR